MTEQDLFDAALNADYMPSQRVAHAKQFFEAWPVESAAVRGQFPPTELAYGAGIHERLDVFEPAQGTRATVLFIHGGYWQAFYKKDFSYLAPPLLGAGIRAVIMSYDLTPGVRLAQIVRQARQAASFVGSQFAEPLLVAGHSAGAHLAAMIHCADWAAERLTPPHLAGSVGISGLYDLLPLRHTELQPNLRLSASEARALSPVSYPPSTPAPFQVAVGELESLAFHQQSALLGAAWPSAVSSVQVLPSRHHFDVLNHLLELTSTLIPIS